MSSKNTFDYHDTRRSLSEGFACRIEMQKCIIISRPLATVRHSRNQMKSNAPNATGASTNNLCLPWTLPEAVRRAALLEIEREQLPGIVISVVLHSATSLRNQQQEQPRTKGWPRGLSTEMRQKWSRLGCWVLSTVWYCCPWYLTSRRVRQAPDGWRLSILSTRSTRSWTQYVRTEVESEHYDEHSSTCRAAKGPASVWEIDYRYDIIPSASMHTYNE